MLTELGMQIRAWNERVCTADWTKRISMCSALCSGKTSHTALKHSKTDICICKFQLYTSVSKHCRPPGHWTLQGASIHDQLCSLSVYDPMYDHKHSATSELLLVCMMPRQSPSVAAHMNAVFEELMQGIATCDRISYTSMKREAVQASTHTAV